MSVVWLASYPKSGNTWLRFLLYHYMYGEARRSEDVGKRIPDIHTLQSLDTTKGESVLCKTHFMYSPAHPHFHETSGFIYILRHPKDVLLSNLNYFRLISGTQIDSTAFAREFIRNEGVPRWKSMGMGSWTEHARSWLTDSRLPHLVLCYESLLGDPGAALEQVVSFLDLDFDEQRLRRAVHLSSFTKMRKLEEKEKSKGKQGVVFAGTPEAARSGLHFMRSGKCGQSLNELGQDIDQAFDQAFKIILPEFGY